MRIIIAFIVFISLVGGVYFSGKRAGISQTTVAWQAKDMSRLSEIVRLQNERDEARVRAEKIKIQREVVYHERIRIVEKLVDHSLDLRMPDCLLYQLQKTGIYTGPGIEDPVCATGNAGGYLSGLGSSSSGNATGAGRL